MLPLDYPPCWEFPLRKNKMHPRYCASNVKERWKKLETLSECMKLALVRKRSDQCSTKKIYLIVVFKTERKGATQVHPAVRSERRPLRNLLFVLTLGRLLDERLSWTPMSRGADNIFHWGKIHDYTRLHSRWLRYCQNVSLVWTRKPVPESWCLAIFRHSTCSSFVRVISDFLDKNRFWVPREAAVLTIQSQLLLFLSNQSTTRFNSWTDFSHGNEVPGLCDQRGSSQDASNCQVFIY